jgi:Tetratricopeptide repeat
MARLATDRQGARSIWMDEMHALLARTLIRQGRLVEAENEAREAALGALAKQYGRYSTHTAWMLRSLTWVLLEQGRYREAETLARSPDASRRCGTCRRPVCCRDTLEGPWQFRRFTLQISRICSATSGARRSSSEALTAMPIPTGPGSSSMERGGAIHRAVHTRPPTESSGIVETTSRPKNSRF